MGTLREEAQGYEPKRTLNIADLDVVHIDDVQLLDGEGTDKNNKPFTYKFFIFNGIEYRVPNSVIEEIQKIIKLRPDIKKIKVTKTGSDLATRYNVNIVDN